MPYLGGGPGYVLRQTVGATPVSKRFTFFNSVTMTEPFWGQDVTPNSAAITAYWNTSDYQFKSATLTFSAHQNYNSGAELHATYNGVDLGTVIGWGAFDNGTHTVSKDVSVVNGDNTLALKYHVDYPNIEGNSCNATATLDIELLPIVQNPTSNPFGPLPTSLGGWNFPLLTKVRTVLSGGGTIIKRPNLGLLKFPSVSGEFLYHHGRFDLGLGDFVYDHGDVDWTLGKGLHHGPVNILHTQTINPTTGNAPNTKFGLKVA